MSHDGKMSKSSKIRNKRKPTKPGPTSEEYIIDSDPDLEHTDKKTPALIKSNSVGTSDSKSSHNLKRKAADISGSNHSQHGKFVGAPKNRREAARQPLANGSQSNGISPKKSAEDATGSSDLSRSSSEEVSSEESSAADHAVKGSAQQPYSELKKSALDSDLSSISRHEIEDESADPSEDKDDEDQDENANSAIGAVQADESSVSPDENRLTVIPPFQPPEGFSSSSISSDHTARVRNIFTEQNLQGKEIWHFTLPASLRIEDIQSFTKPHMLNGKSVLKYQGSDYSFHVESGKGTVSKVLIPARTGNKYQPVSASIDQTLHLRQMTGIPIANTGLVSETSGTITGARKPILKQPKGLKLGYLPFGDTATDANEQAAIKQAEQRMENTKIPVPTEPLPVVKKAKKSKKSSLEVDRPTEWVDPEAYSAPVVLGSASQHTIDFPSEHIDTIPSTSLHGSQSNSVKTDVLEEKVRRKAEKAARREARRANKEVKTSKE